MILMGMELFLQVFGHKLKKWDALNALKTCRIHPVENMTVMEFMEIHPIKF